MQLRNKEMVALERRGSDNLLALNNEHLLLLSKPHFKSPLFGIGLITLWDSLPGIFRPCCSPV